MAHGEGPSAQLLEELMLSFSSVLLLQSQLASACMQHPLQHPIRLQHAWNVHPAPAPTAHLPSRAHVHVQLLFRTLPRLLRWPGANDDGLAEALRDELMPVQ